MKARRKHIIIGGTGRAGTSFLVQFLAELGMDTHLARNVTPFWDEDANAGLEDNPISGNPDTLPHVIKSPRLFEYVDQLVARDDIEIECVILPLRDLMKASSSRVIAEMRARYKNAPSLAEFDGNWETWAMTPGGLLFSLNPLDEARILAVGFHQVVERLTAADIPIVFLAFPRFAEDWEYLYQKLKLYLPAQAGPDKARNVHGRIADSTKIRVEKELQDDNGDNGSSEVVQRNTRVRSPPNGEFETGRSTGTASGGSRRSARRKKRPDRRTRRPYDRTRKSAATTGSVVSQTRSHTRPVWLADDRTAPSAETSVWAETAVQTFWHLTAASAGFALRKRSTACCGGFPHHANTGETKSFPIVELQPSWLVSMRGSAPFGGN